MNRFSTLNSRISLEKPYVDNPEAEEELKNIILAQTGKSVELKMVVAKEHNHTNLAKVTVDQALREKYPYGCCCGGRS